MAFDGRCIPDHGVARRAYARYGHFSRLVLLCASSISVRHPTYEQGYLVRRGRQRSIVPTPALDPVPKPLNYPVGLRAGLGGKSRVRFDRKTTSPDGYDTSDQPPFLLISITRALLFSR